MSSSTVVASCRWDVCRCSFMAADLSNWCFN